MSTALADQSQRRPEFVTLIAIYQFVTAGILLLVSCLIPALLFPLVLFNVDQAEGIVAGFIFGGIALALLLGFGFASIVVGWGLLRMREWARLGAIVLAAFALVGFPIWTIVAILVLVYMTSEEARFAFNPQEAPPEIIARTISTADPDAPDQAAYKAEPPGWTRPSPAQETRRVDYVPPEPATNGAPGQPPPPDETRRIAGPIPMPEPHDPSEATETFYDQEADVSDHYRRWKASLPQEPATSEESPAEVSEVPAPDETEQDGSTEAAAAAGAELQETSGEPAPEDEPTTVSEDLTPDEEEVSGRIWGPTWAFQQEPEEVEDAPAEPVESETGAEDEDESPDTEADEPDDAEKRPDEPPRS